MSGYLIRTLARLRRRVTTKRELRVVWILFVVAVLSVAPAFTYLLCAAVEKAETGGSPSDQLYRLTSDGLASGEPQLLSAAVLVLVLVPSCARVFSRLRQLHRLVPLWTDVTAAVPMVVLRLRWSDRWGAWPTETVERRRIEIRDAAEILASYACPLPEKIDELVESTVGVGEQEQMRQVAELVVAARQLAAEPHQVTSDPPARRAVDALDVDDLLGRWALAKSIVQEGESASSKGA
ncbi:DUF6545 domain-containing protein [Nocardia sp. NPDC059246]|uniref:DUF6545 domain-containing protein n=1 Tax=unclassified Nocardia TaxID=2637762 RepID=UPI00369A389B